jgi:hypothetical protein
MITDYEYISFKQDPVDKNRKTLVFTCVTNNGGVLGEVSWYSPWRQYCYFATRQTVYSKGCLNDIHDFIEQLMDARKMGDE